MRILLWEQELFNCSLRRLCVINETEQQHANNRHRLLLLFSLFVFKNLFIFIFILSVLYLFMYSFRIIYFVPYSFISYLSICLFLSLPSLFTSVRSLFLPENGALSSEKS
jgi:hypothetical protein